MPTPPDDILLNKAAIIERCIRRMRDEFHACPALDDFTRVDALTLNIERACQAAIDVAMHIVAERHLGVPQSTADAFLLLERAGVLDRPLTASLCGMVGSRNVAVHQYEDIDMSVLRWIVESGFRDWIRLGEALGVAIRP
ncbi:MAG: type VII toxin-antitoxin system HepT family RNase toxin [Planctomycetaceae bacterium]